MRPVVLSERLRALADMVTPGLKMADVGCDHGFLSIYLVEQGISPGIVAMDVRQGPLSAARQHIAEHRKEAYIETRLSDGLEALAPGEVQGAICAGMGGKLMEKILTEGREKAILMKELILQPQSELFEFRRFLKREGYQILEEEILYEEGKYYFPMKVRWIGNAKDSDTGFPTPGEEGLCLLGEKYGSLLLERRHPVLRRYLETGLENMLEIERTLLGNDTGRARERLEVIREEIRYLRQALALF